MLPVFNLSTGHRLGLQALGLDPGGRRYRDYAMAAAAAYAQVAPALAGQARPGPPAGEVWMQAAVRQI